MLAKGFRSKFRSWGNAVSREPYSGSDDPELDPYEINFLPEFRTGRGADCRRLSTAAAL